MTPHPKSRGAPEGVGPVVGRGNPSFSSPGREHMCQDLLTGVPPTPTLRTLTLDVTRGEGLPSVCDRPVLERYSVRSKLEVETVNNRHSGTPQTWYLVDIDPDCGWRVPPPSRTPPPHPAVGQARGRLTVTRTGNRDVTTRSCRACRNVTGTNS